ncbi:branched-chain amino acid ABC transporter substrate-binding protein [Herbaspirillum robiniae]|uniref:Branched-chain amino acid ABC transporter substrate-binding protein n=2 Tax=Herbaspirillum robiniae TaxID=2014887 RepID=A0A246WNP6_9BURK|nr:branched-chain amino acid ABC transporter substrate-binding protein [Herbaspirillum robiniae]
MAYGMRRRIYRGILLAACLLPSWHAAAQDDARTRIALIGFAGPLSDQMVQSAQQGALLAIEEANRRPQPGKQGPPLHFELLSQDDKSNSNLAGYVARYFVTSRVIGVLGHWNTGPAIAAAPVYDAAGVAQVSFTATGSQLTRKGYRNVFRVVGSTDDTAAYLAESADKIMDSKRVAIIHNDTAFSAALTAAFVRELSARAIPVVSMQAVSGKTSDFNAQLRAAVDSGADLILLSAITGQLQPFVNTAKRMNVSTRILLTGGATNQKLDDAGQVYAIEPNLPQQRCSHQKGFEQRYLARFERAPTTFSRYAFDAANLLIQAARQADSERAPEVSAELRELRYAGLSGDIAFDKDGNNSHPAYTLYRSSPQGWQPLRVLSSEQGVPRCARG